MKYIANIITTSKKYKFNEFINIVDTLEEADLSVPTLVVGTELAKSFFGEKLNHIVRRVDENTFWTYSTTENRTANEKDLAFFKKEIINKLHKNIDYRYFNGRYRRFAAVPKRRIQRWHRHFGADFEKVFQTQYR